MHNTTQTLLSTQGNKAAAQLVGNIYPNDDNCFGQVRKPYKAIASDICI